jgi:hypothetical protein
MGRSHAPPTPAELLAMAVASPEAPTEWEVAFHEAGHVVAEVVLCRSYPDEVHLNDDPEDESHAGRTTGRSFLGTLPVGGWTGDAEVVAIMEGMTVKYGVVLAAGVVAVQMAWANDVDTYDLAWEVLGGEAAEKSDEGLLAGLVVSLTEATAETWIEDRYEESVVLLRSNWERVEALATALVDSRRLDREALWGIFDAP